MKPSLGRRTVFVLGDLFGSWHRWSHHLAIGVIGRHGTARVIVCGLGLRAWNAPASRTWSSDAANPHTVGFVRNVWAGGTCSSYSSTVQAVQPECLRRALTEGFAEAWLWHLRLLTVSNHANAHRSSTVHSPQSTVHSPQSTVHSPQSTVHSPQSTVHSPQPTVHSPQSTVHSPQPTVHSPQSTVHNPHPTLRHTGAIVPVHCPCPSSPDKIKSKSVGLA
ncbi:hypothetical protein B0T19DRAFT_121442 [Cercophora scortea]|uniref:Uncharacterized protein n=1 Tax=Cercophora scortea TaxID=314031 RepID=A0AAE0MIU7_9PEZI|nr:hypothetical protein B0T19DRAFT_121442 [Cercophora scortea]